MNQKQLFAVEPEAYARRSDPETSHQAAATVDAAELERLCVETLKRYPDGLTTLEIAEITGIQRVSISPRMRPLANKGLICDSGTTRSIGGRASIVWSVI